MGFSLSGLSTGLDTASMITQLMELERRPQTLLKAQQQTNNNKISEYQKISDALTALQALAKGFQTSSTFSSLKTFVTTSTVLTATATSAATPGDHTVQVVSLAKSQRQVSTGVTSDTSLIFDTGSFTISDGTGGTTTVNIAEGQNSLKGIAAAINSSGANVSASTINDGTNYRLVVSGKDTKNYTADFSGLTTAPAGGTGSLKPVLLGAGDPSYQAGADAQIVVDGIAMTKSSNTVTDAIQGITLNLLTEGATTGVAVSTDTDTITQKIKDFVAGYNRVVTLLNSESSYNSTTKKGGVLSGDTTVRSVQNQLRSLLTTTVSGATGSFQTLASVGINSDSKTGTLSLDSTKFSAALKDDYNDVVDLFTHNGDSLTALNTNQYGIAQQFNKVIDAMVRPYVADGLFDNGLIETRKKGLTKNNEEMTRQIAAMETRVLKMQANLQRQFNLMEATVARLQAQGSTLLNYLGANKSSNSTNS